MADENKALVNGLPEHSKIENTDRFLGSGASEEFLVNLDNLASAVFEKIKSEFGAAAFLKVANNDTTTATGYVADARAVNALGKEVDELNSSSVKVRTANSWTMIEYPNNLVEMWRYATILSAANAKTNTLSLPTPMKDNQYGVKISPVFNGHLCKSVWAGTKTGADGRTETTVQISMDSTDSDSNVGVFVFVTGYREA